MCLGPASPTLSAFLQTCSFREANAVLTGEFKKPTQAKPRYTRDSFSSSSLGELYDYLLRVLKVQARFGLRSVFGFLTNGFEAALMRLDRNDNAPQGECSWRHNHKTLTIIADPIIWVRYVDLTTECHLLVTFAEMARERTKLPTVKGVAVSKKFELTGALHQGPTSVVVSADVSGPADSDPRFGAVIKYSASEDWDFLIEREFSLLRQINSNGTEDSLPLAVCKVAVQVGGATRPGLAMTPEGGRVRRATEGFRLTTAHVKKLINVLEAMHKKGFVHCDVATRNFVLRIADKEIMLIDFAFARPTGTSVKYAGTWDTASAKVIRHMISNPRDEVCVSVVVEFVTLFSPLLDDIQQQIPISSDQQV